MNQCRVILKFILGLYPRYLEMQVYSTSVFIQSSVAPPCRERPCASSRLALNKNRRTLNPAFPSILGIESNIWELKDSVLCPYFLKTFFGIISSPLVSKIAAGTRGSQDRFIEGSFGLAIFFLFSKKVSVEIVGVYIVRV